ncbi:MAG TPA: 16S rRNA (cytosine(1402)-N(4))-methyltransferase, partial [Candidatus Paceibacterota bacterium]|nr:16S rRNA (cytosine(1402)-N(4))-methyltransferase [Candidatus Paceibacterota bacterium]
MTLERHTPVLSESVLRFLDPKPGSVMVDCTLNGGGHAALLASHGARVIGIEWDPSIAGSFFDHRPELRDAVTVVNANYTELERICAEQGIVPDGILFDLGISSIHYAESGRGFSFNQPDEPLDMRFNPQATASTAGRIINEAEPAELERILREYGEEQFAG